MIRPPPLPFSEDALSPYLSPRTVHFHRRKQIRYVERTNALVEGTPLEDLSLGAVVVQAELMMGPLRVDPERSDDRAAPGPPDGGMHEWAFELCEQSSQAWNHALMWLSMSPVTRRRKVRPAWINRMRDDWFEEAKTVLGSGWVWLIEDSTGAVGVEATTDADRPVGGRPLAVMDLWEHAYYLDLPDQKTDYVRMWWDHLADFSVALAILDGKIPKAIA